MIFNINYAVALLEKLCDSQGIDYSEEKKYWQARAQKYQEQYDAEQAEKNKTRQLDKLKREAYQEEREAHQAETTKRMKAIAADYREKMGKL